MQPVELPPLPTPPPPLPSSRRKKRLFIALGIAAAAVLLLAGIFAGIVLDLPYLSPKTSVVYTADAAGVQPADLVQAAQILNERWHTLGNCYRAVKFEAVAGNMLRGGIPADSDPQLIGQMASTGIIEFVDFGSLPVAAGTEVQTDLYDTGSESTYHTILTGREMKSVGLETDNFGNIATKFQLTEQGTQILADYTTAHTGEYLGIVWDGVVISAPRVAAAITDGVGIISGFGSEAQARAFVAVVRSGVLPVPLMVGEVKMLPASDQP